MICLQNLCLSLIAEEFKRFHFAFEVSNNDNLKRNFKFLQRKYSYELASELYKKKTLKVEHLEFLLNEHLKVFDEKWLDFLRYRLDIDISTKDILYRLPNLTKISCHETDDEILENIAKFCSNIVEIEGLRSSVTDHGITFLCRNENGSVPCPQLKIIRLVSSTVTHKGVTNLIQNLRCLEKIHHDSVPLALYYLHKEDFLKLETIPGYNLIELDVYRIYRYESLPAYYYNLLKICLTACPKLKSLRCSISDKQQLDLFNNTCLEDLQITFLDEKINIDSFLKNCGSKLISLYVRSCMISISELAVNCPKLKHLFLKYVTFPDDHCDSNVDFHHLVSCTFSKIEDSETSDKAISLLLLSSPNLECLTFNYCDLSHGTETYVFKCFANLPLKRITFKRCDVESNFIKGILERYTSLEILCLHLCHFPVDDRKKLVRFAKTLPNKPFISFIELE